LRAATLLAEVGDPSWFATESKFARWCGTGAVAISSGEGNGLPVRHSLDFRCNRRINSVLHIANVTQHRDQPDARTYIDRKTSEGKTRREARRAHKRHLANPRHPSHVERRTPPTSTINPTRRLTRERLTDPHQTQSAAGLQQGRTPRSSEWPAELKASNEARAI
jgi:Transposase IS116/IS110/IS902 family